MGILSWIILILGTLWLVGVVRTILMFKKLSKEERQKALNYRLFLKIGTIMIPVGFLFLLLAIIQDYKLWTSIVIISIGLVYLVIGLIIKNKRSQKI
jgi:hypothetical protein